MSPRALLLAALLAVPMGPVAVAVPVPGPAPTLDGVWSGTMSGKTYSLETGVKPAKVKVPVSLVAFQEGAAVSATLTLHGDGGDEAFGLEGRSGNGAFWIYNGDEGAPFMIVGTISGKAPRLKVKARGVLASFTEVSEVTFSLKKSQAALKGTAAAGGAIAGADITLKDRNGTAVTATTGEDGAFALDTAGLQPPFLLKVDLPAGGVLYGVATEAGVANIHPLTDLILRTWYAVDGTDIDDAFATLGPTTHVPSALDVALLEGLVRRAISKWLSDQGIDPGTFDLIRSSFAADGSGFDAVLDGTSVSPDGSSLTISDGTTTQSSAITVSSVSGTVTVDTTTTSPAGSSASQDGTALAVDDASQAAVAGALATMEAFRAKINARGAALTASDIAAFMTTDFLEDGVNRTIKSAELATDLRGATLGPVGLRSFSAFDAEAGTIVLDLLIAAQGGEGAEQDRETFKKVGSTWLIHGNRQIADVNVKVEYRTDYYPGMIDGPRKSINVDVRAGVGQVQSATISGGGVFNATVVAKDSQTEIQTFHPTPSTDLEYERDAFFAGADLADFPAPGTPFQVTVTPVTGTPKIYTVLSGGTTTETVSILQPTGNSVSTDAHPGSPFTVQWTLPTTFAIQRLQLSGLGYTSSFTCRVDSNEDLSLSATQGTVTIPTTCGAESVTSANFNLTFDGPNGERIIVIYEFQ